MYWKIEIKNTTVALGLQYNRQEKVKLFLFKWYYNKQATQIGTVSTTRSLAIGIQYANQRVKVLTQQQQTIKKRIA